MFNAIDSLVDGVDSSVNFIDSSVNFIDPAVEKDNVVGTGDVTPSRGRQVLHQGISHVVSKNRS